MAISTKAEDVVFPQMSRGRLVLVVEDENTNPLEPDSVSFTLIGPHGQPIASHTDADQEIDNPSPGVYTFDLDGSLLSHPGELVANWLVEDAASGELVNAIQRCSVISNTLALRLKDFRLLIDKSRKFVDPYNDTFLGYTDAQLLSYLSGGMATINSYQPGAVSWTLDGFPWAMYGQVGLEAGLLVGVMSQQLFAIDTDIPNYSDQGTTFTLAHQPQLATFFNQVAQRLDKMIPALKLNFINTGSIHTQMGPSYRFQHLINAAPTGSGFRGIHFGA